MPIRMEPEIAGALLRIFETGDVVVGTEQIEEIAQRAGTLCQSQDEIFLQPGIAHGTLLGVGRALEIEIAAGGDHATIVLPRMLSRSIASSAVIASAPAGSSTTPSAFSISVIVTQMAFSAISVTCSAAKSFSAAEIQVADTADGRAVDKSIDLSQRHHVPSLRCCAAGCVLPPARQRRMTPW